MISALLLSALITVESNGNAGAVGDHGRSLGALQIQASVIEDVNRFAGTRYSHEDAHNVTHAKEICRLYLEHYATAPRLGRQATDQDRARIWNGGPDGWHQRCTRSYWTKVQRAMNQRSAMHIPPVTPHRRPR